MTDGKGTQRVKQCTLTLEANNGGVLFFYFETVFLRFQAGLELTQ